MKKIIFTLTFIAVVFLLLVSCDREEPVDIDDFPTTVTTRTSEPATTTTTETTTTTTTTSTTSSAQTTTTTTSTTANKKLPVYVPGSIKLVDINDLDEQLVPLYGFSYRLTYYQIDGYFDFLVDKDENDKWYNAITKKDIESKKEISEMFLVSFVKHFNIPRKDFDEVVERMRQACINLEQDMTDERYELPNADIIYTFDNDIINEYYRRQ